jgi:hypothetical protein
MTFQSQHESRGHRQEIQKEGEWRNHDWMRLGDEQAEAEGHLSRDRRSCLQLALHGPQLEERICNRQKN